MIPAPPDEVWARWTDVPRWPEWNEACIEARVDGAVEAGAVLDLRLRHPGGRPFITRPRVTDVDEGRRFEWAAYAMGFEALTETVMTPEDDGTRVIITTVSHGPLAFTYRLVMRPATQRAIHELMLDSLRRDLAGA